MTLPSDPFMLLGVVNMLLRDKYSSLDELCAEEDAERDALCARLAPTGYQYSGAVNQFVKNA